MANSRSGKITAIRTAALSDHSGSRLSNVLDLRMSLVLATGALVVTASSGCEQAASSAAPPMVVCGTELYGGPNGQVLFDATQKLSNIKYTGSENLLYFQVALGCDHGSIVTWSPKTAATLIKTANAKDGHPAAVVLKVSGPRAAFQLIAKQNGKVVASATVKLTP